MEVQKEVLLPTVEDPDDDGPVPIGHRMKSAPNVCKFEHITYSIYDIFFVFVFWLFDRMQLLHVINIFYHQDQCYNYFNQN